MISMKKLGNSSNDNGRERNTNRPGKQRPLVEEPFRRRISRLIEALGDLNNLKRGEAASTLLMMEHDGVTPALIEAIDSRNNRVQAAAIIILGMRHEDSAVPALCKALENNDFDLFKKDIAWALGEIRNTSAVPALVEAFTNVDPDVSEAACDALVKMGREVVPLVAEQLKSRDWSVQVCAAEALGRIGDESAVPALLEASNDKNEMVAVSALGAADEIRRKKGE